MTLALEDRWIWDFWLVRDGLDHHVFYLQAPNTLGHPDLRHRNVTVGHAVSTDLRDWKVLPDALAPGPPGSWDDSSTWTGSVVRHDGRWAMLYTGTSSAESGLVQRVGLAESDDLVAWRKHDGPVLEADPRWYETLDQRAWFDQAWRDPWVYRDPADGQWHALVCARTRAGDPAERGVVGHARSGDLRAWEVLPPVTAPMGFGQMEVPQLVAAAGRWFLVFCSDLETQTPGRQASGPGTGTYYLVGDGPTGPFAPDATAARAVGTLEADRRGSTYAGKLHETTDGDLVFLAWHRCREDGGFHGALSDPRPVEARSDGTLVLR